MTESTMYLLAGLILLVALLYSTVGHAGASGYLAAMALLGVAPALMKPTSLSLNIVVATIAGVQFARAGCFSWTLFWPFAVTSVPMAFLGGRATLPGDWYKPLVGLVLLFAAWRQWVRAKGTSQRPIAPPPRPTALFAGSVLGLVSGLTGTGGGIFLSPLLIQCGWADPRRTAGVSAVFVLVNSVAGLAGLRTTAGDLPRAIPLWAAMAVIGGAVGSYLGSRKLGFAPLQRALAAVLVVAGLKLILLR